MKDKFIKDDAFSCLLYYFGAEEFITLYEHYLSIGDKERVDKMRKIADSHMAVAGMKRSLLA